MCYYIAALRGMCIPGTVRRYEAPETKTILRQKQIPGTLSTCIYRKSLSDGVLVSIFSRDGSRQSRRRLSRMPRPGPSLLAPLEFRHRRLESVQQQERILCRLVHVAEGATAYVPVQRRGKPRRRHLFPLIHAQTSSSRMRNCVGPGLAVGAGRRAGRRLGARLAPDYLRQVCQWMALEFLSKHLPV